MIRASAAALALAAFAIPWSIAPVRPVALAGGVGLALAAAGIAPLWRWPALAAACAFLVEYAAALSLGRAPLGVGGALAFGLALLLLLASVELGRGCRLAAVSPRVLRSQLLSWLGFAAATLLATLLGLSVAGGLAGSIPSWSAPLLAALGALGVIVALATIVKRPAR
jgi:branched-subunit amino acid transport protein